MRNKLTHDRPTLFLDQYGRGVVASSRAELVRLAGGGKVSKQYVDMQNGVPAWNGYIVGCRWFSAFKWQEVPA